MTDLFATKTEILPACKISGRVSGLFAALAGDFVTTPASSLELTFDGIVGDYHAGPTRKSGGREPWYPRGTEMRNERQLSILASDELEEVATGMGLPELKPEWIGGNMVVGGVPSLSMLPPRTLLFFEGGVTLRVDGQNAPCKIAGRSIGEHAETADHTTTALDFVRVSRRLRGIVAWVEKPGIIRTGEKVDVRVPEQWIYQP
ncbi:MOSC domain-containing protein [Phyllobacterium zundukense]|uniref:Molybdenum cofactor sulfurase n=1 Tax=Phyllobacterium zundukense TaxID=1867719 RepID=A0A2N9W2T1_9HYPH|nr:MOSC domain-containing protein [Phyllobacterium zundukense]ATU93662.1 molybdenum cofactor sulfurase [Phyllobacterium zundukense]PIO46049.1 molybdenum cofactor sulfurase [Phyllobacterium zundukense]